MKPTIDLLEAQCARLRGRVAVRAIGADSAAPSILEGCAPSHPGRITNRRFCPRNFFAFIFMVAPGLSRPRILGPGLASVLASLVFAAAPLLPSAAADTEASEPAGGDKTLLIQAGGRCLEMRKGAAGVALRDADGPAERIAMIAPMPCAVAVADWTPVVRDSGTARCKVVFSGQNGVDVPRLEILMRADGAIMAAPLDNCSGVSISADFAYGVLPSRHLDDVVFPAEDCHAGAAIRIPSESLFMGLLEGGGRVLAFAWAPGEHSVSIRASADGKAISSLEFSSGGQGIWLRDFCEPGIWREVKLDDSFEERYAAIDWRPPFDAQWKIQIPEHGVPTTFKLLRGRKSPWRPGVGKFVYPFVTDGEKVEIYLYKELASSGRAIIYALEGHQNTPYAFLVSALRRDDCDKLSELGPVRHYSALDPGRTPQGRVPDGATMDLWCGGRDFLKNSSFATGAFAGETEFLDRIAAERVSHLRAVSTCYFQRLVETLDALDELTRQWETGAGGDGTVPGEMRSFREALDEMSKMCRGRMGGLTPAGIVDKAEAAASAFGVAIRDGSGIEVYPEVLFWLDELNSLLYVEEAAGQRSGTYGRALFQKAGRGSAAAPELVPYMEKTRETIRNFMAYRSNYELPTPEGYALPAGHVFAEGLLQEKNKDAE